MIPRPRTMQGRVTGWVLLLVTVTLSLNLLAVAVYLHERNQAAIETELEHEAVKFRRFLNSVDAAETDSVARVLHAYVQQAFPDTREAILGVVDGVTTYRTPGLGEGSLTLDSSLVSRAMRAQEPFTVSVDGDHGHALASVIPVRQSAPAGQQGALVIVESAQEQQQGITDTVQVLGLVGLAAISLTGMVSWLIAGRVAAPLRQVVRTAEAIDARALSARIPTDEGDLDEDVIAMATTFNRMLDRLEAAVESQRDFLDDAAHEMRTPLTIIRGHLETMKHRSGDDVATVRLLVGEVARMDRLVSDLLILAKAARPDFLNRHAVDLDDLVVRAVATASALGQREWRVIGTAQARVLADEQRLTQALMQLTANAVEHTRPGDTIAVGVECQRDWFELSVTDSGPGVPLADQERIFDRFQQGNRSGTRNGTGLGLAIVRSIAQAHGGSASVTSAPAGGARFTLRLPRHDVAEPSSDLLDAVPQ